MAQALFLFVIRLHLNKLGLCSKFLGGSEDSMLCTPYCFANPYCARTLGSSLLIARTLGWSYHNIFLCYIGFSDPLIGYFFCRSIFQFVFLLQSLDPRYSLISLQLFVIGYVHLISLILWEMHTFWVSSYYIGLLNFSSHFGNRCQWGRSLEGLREFGFML